MIRKVTCLILALATLLSLFSACGGVISTSETDEVIPDAPIVDMGELCAAMISADESFPAMTTVDSSEEKASKLFIYISEMDYSKVDGFLLSYADDGASYELAVIAVKDRGDVREAEASLKEHLESRINLYKNYSPENLPNAEAALVGTNGRYAYLIMCDDPNAVKAAMIEKIRNQ